MRLKIVLVILAFLLISSTSNAIIPDIDTTPPTVSVSVSPSNPSMYDIVTITVSASDASGIGEIYVNVDEELQTICSSSPCSYSSRYTGAAHFYSTATLDNAGNRKTVSGSFSVSIVPPTNTLKFVFVPVKTNFNVFVGGTH